MKHAYISGLDQDHFFGIFRELVCILCPGVLIELDNRSGNERLRTAESDDKS